MPNSKRKTGRLGVVLATAGLAVLLAACGSADIPDAAGDTKPINNIVEGQPLTPAFIGFVKLGENQTLEQAAAATGGRPVHDGRLNQLSTASTTSTTSIGFLAFDSQPLGSQMAGAEEFEIIIEENEDRFMTSANLVEAQGSSKVWAEGSSKVWAEGNSKVWAEGNSKVWAEGQFSWMPENTSTWRQIELRDGHDEARRLGNRVVVAIIDTGVDTTHPALSEALSPNGWNFVDNNGDVSEVGSLEDHSYGHGTVVAGIVRQIAPRATILPIRALDADGSGDVLNVVRAVYYAVQEDADIINLSLGSPVESPALSEAIRFADSEGVFVTISTGNDDKDSLNFPSAIANTLDFVISVTSVDKNDRKSSFSNYGREAEIAAPGEQIYGPYPGLGLASWSGTSMAAPQVAGALALALGEPELEVRKSRLAREMFEESEDIYKGSMNQYKNGRLLGAGRLDIEEFLDEVVD